MIDKAVGFVMSRIDARVGKRDLSPDAPVEYELPESAVAEAIANAVAHRDYTSNASVQVMLFRDRLEIWNRNCMRYIAPNRPIPYWLIRFSWQAILSIWAQVLRI